MSVYKIIEKIILIKMSMTKKSTDKKSADLKTSELKPDELKPSNMNLTGTVVAVNTFSLGYLYYWLWGMDDDFKKEKVYSGVIRRNLNILNLEFKKSLFSNNKETERTREDIDELREMLMFQSNEIYELREVVKKVDRTSKTQNTTVNPLVDKHLVKTSDPESIDGKSNDGSQTEKIR